MDHQWVGDRNHNTQCAVCGEFPHPGTDQSGQCRGSFPAQGPIQWTELASISAQQRTTWQDVPEEAPVTNEDLLREQIKAMNEKLDRILEKACGDEL